MRPLFEKKRVAAAAKALASGSHADFSAVNSTYPVCRFGMTKQPMRATFQWLTLQLTLRSFSNKEDLRRDADACFGQRAAA